jgi:predicted dehydrogenase
MSAKEPPVGVVVVGTSFGCLTHVRALRAAGFEVQALVGRDPEKTAERAKRFEVPNGLTSLAEALALPGVDAVTVATPPHTHASIVLDAVAAGKHVVCEKPFARDAAEARLMLKAAEDAGIVHLLGTEFRWAPGQALMARLVTDGAIGEPRVATFLFHMPLLADPAAEVPAWWSDAEQGGGWLGAYAAHIVDQVRTTVGEFEGVSASLVSVADHGWTSEDTYTVHFRVQGGCAGLLQSCASDWGPMVMLGRVAGSHGTVWTEGDTVRVADKNGTRTIDLPDDLHAAAPDPPPADLLVTTYDFLHSMGIDFGPYVRLFETFRDLIAGQPVPTDPRPATFADGVTNMAVLDAIRRSAAERSWVTIA